jgi:hypothetical protein
MAQPDIDQCDPRLQFGGHAQGRYGITRTPEDLVTQLGEHDGQILRDERLILDNEDA